MIVWSVIITLVVYFSAACWGFVLALPTMVEHDADEADTPLGDAGVDREMADPALFAPEAAAEETAPSGASLKVFGWAGMR
jgi:hypothetical protein